ncbi:glycosyltransferase [bacterium]|jgi:glycosyltransferase involved in cell wall biosynthesis|nr:glycosyltransferase [bacterium]MBT4250006.1 glycosyltransferase [bacterium]MBT5734305.1 glycosyltransferase [bacterium]MBT6017721.1 glycosyltransferase [bacterium]MBT6777911.1 glycosyltransferase [bacterium]
MDNFSNPSITVSISTIAKNLDRFCSSFSFQPLEDADEVIIIVQGSKDKTLQSKLKDYTVIFDDQLGLSRSRNIAIEKSKSDFIWFLDDDVVLKSNCIKKLKKSLKINKYASLFTVRMSFLDDSPYKNYTNKKILGRLGSLKVSSVELVVSKEFVLKNNIRFNESLGLGSKFPSTEENVFYLDIFDEGGLIIHLPEFLLKHEFINRKEAHFSNISILKAKGMFCFRYGGLLGFLIFIYYLVKCILISKNYKLSLALFKGYRNSDGII